MCTSGSAVVVECLGAMATYSAMPMPANALWKKQARQLWHDERIALATDNSLLIDGWVYVINHELYGHPDPGPIQRIDYFHGEFEGYVIAQMCDRNETDVLAKDMIKLTGWVERAVTHIQRLFRSRI